MADLFSTRLMEHLGDFFPQSCTIQSLTETVDDNHQVVEAWADIAGHVSIPCSVKVESGDEVRTDVQTYAIATHTIALQGYYPAITEKMRAVVDGQEYDILLPMHSGFGVNTRLKCRVVTL